MPNYEIYTIFTTQNGWDRFFSQCGYKRLRPDAWARESDMRIAFFSGKCVELIYQCRKTFESEIKAIRAANERQLSH